MSRPEHFQRPARLPTTLLVAVGAAVLSSLLCIHLAVERHRKVAKLREQSELLLRQTEYLQQRVDRMRGLRWLRAEDSADWTRYYLNPEVQLQGLEYRVMDLDLDGDEGIVRYDWER
jgi:hypothetical protein